MAYSRRHLSVQGADISDVASRLLHSKARALSLTDESNKYTTEAADRNAGDLNAISIVVKSNETLDADSTAMKPAEKVQPKGKTGIQKLRNAVKTKKVPKLFELYQQLRAEQQVTVGIGLGGKSISGLTQYSGQDMESEEDEIDESEEEEIEFQRQQRRKRVKLMLIQSTLARNLTDDKQRELTSHILKAGSRGSGNDKLHNEFNVSTPDIGDNYVSRKKSLDAIVSEFLEGSAFNLEHTAGLISHEDYVPMKERTALGSGLRKKKVALNDRAKEMHRGSFTVTEEDGGGTGEVSEVQQGSEFEDERSLLNDMMIYHQSDYYLAGRKRQSIFIGISAAARFYKIARCVAILCVFFQFRSSAQTPSAFRGVSFLASADAKKQQQGKQSGKAKEKDGGNTGFMAQAVTGPADSPMAFNSSLFKAGEEMGLKKRARIVLSKMPEQRTKSEKSDTLRMLKSHISGFIEYPARLQHMLVAFGIYAQISASRVIIKQGHTAEWFYLILSGTVSVQTHPDNDMSTVTVVGTLGKGETTGEMETLKGAKRQATMVCKKQVEVVGLTREDFCNIFMYRPRSDLDFTYISFLKSLDLFSCWSGLEQLAKLAEPDYEKCFVSYFKRGRVIATDYKECKYIYVLLSGKCSVRKRLHINDEEAPEKGENIWDLMPLNKDNIRRFKNGDLNLTVEMRNLYTGHSYGLEGIVYRSELEELGVVESTSGGSSKASLISESCECVMIDKQFFLQHFNEKCKIKMQSRVDLYSEKGELVERLTDQETWRKNRTKIIKKTLARLDEKKKFKTIY